MSLLLRSLFPSTFFPWEWMFHWESNFSFFCSDSHWHIYQQCHSIWGSVFSSKTSRTHNLWGYAFGKHVSQSLRVRNRWWSVPAHRYSKGIFRLRGQTPPPPWVLRTCRWWYRRISPTWPVVRRQCKSTLRTATRWRSCFRTLLGFLRRTLNHFSNFDQLKAKNNWTGASMSERIVLQIGCKCTEQTSNWKGTKELLPSSIETMIIWQISIVVDQVTIYS